MARVRKCETLQRVAAPPVQVQGPGEGVGGRGKPFPEGEEGRKELEEETL